MYFSMAAELASAARQNEALPADYYNSTLAPEPRCIELYISAAVHIHTIPSQQQQAARFLFLLTMCVILVSQFQFFSTSPPPPLFFFFLFLTVNISASFLFLALRRRMNAIFFFLYSGSDCAIFLKKKKITNKRVRYYLADWNSL